MAEAHVEPIQSGAETITAKDPATTPEAPAAPEQTPSEEGVKATPPTPENERPSWLPQQFSSPEQLAEAWNDLQGEASSSEAAPDSGPATDEAPGSSDEEMANTAQALVEGAGLEFESLAAHWQEHGELPEDAYGAFQEHYNLSKEIVNDFLLGQQARVDAYRTQAITAAGGQETFDAAAEWAGQALSDAELNAYNSAVESGNFERAKLAVQGLVQKFQDAQGAEPNLAEGDGAAVGGANAFESREQLTAAINDPRYATDPAYRAEVERRLAVSNSLF